ncbi:MAG: DNA repair protein RadA [Actinobacteria bacterium]|nr:DNA repair protein RadA [Actinomycetota bacterium]
MIRTRVRSRAVYACTECGAQAPKWLGRCPECGAWSTLVEEVFDDPLELPGAPFDVGERPVPLATVDPLAAAGRPTGVDELDRVLGGGLVPGSVTLLAGEPGIGKSTLLLQALGRLAGAGARCLLVSAEESKEQVRLRAGRIEALDPNLLVVAETSLPNVLAHVDEVAPEVLAIDSVQTIVDPDQPGVPGSIHQVRECAHRLVRVAKARGLATVLVGHVTKDGAIAGPRALEHVVDTVLAFEGDRHHALRMLHALKHRFGSTNELGVFEMRDGGLADVADPSALFLADRRAELSGSVVTPILEGGRPLLVEVQALVVPATGDAPSRRATQGVDGGRLALLQAVLDRRGEVKVGAADVYASVAGGIRVADPGIDLALTLALASARLDRPIPADLVAVGEVGLGGEVRLAAQTPRRLAEAARLGFRFAVVPVSAPAVEGITSIPVRGIAEALALAGMYD